MTGDSLTEWFRNLKGEYLAEQLTYYFTPVHDLDEMIIPKKESIPMQYSKGKYF